MLDLQFGPETPEHDHAPEHQPHDQQYLPQPPQIEILPALRAEERPHTAREPPLIAGGFTGEAPHNHHDQGHEERHAENALATWLRSRNHRREIDPRSQEGGDHPEQSELKVPFARGSGSTLARSYPKKPPVSAW